MESPAYDAFDLSRHEADTTMETVLDDTAPYNLLDTSRRPEQRSSADLADTSFNKLPDDNMNCEPTLQPNG